MPRLKGREEDQLILTQDDQYGLPTPEEPEDFTLADLRERALTVNYDSRIEFEKLKQAVFLPRTHS